MSGAEFTPDREIDATRREEDSAEATLRPQTLADFTGQKASRENLAIFIAAARQRGGGA
jgi:Holliday junction DNA helicase RuvB